MSSECAWQHELIDIGANLLNPQFQGEYRGERKHAADLQLVLERASRAGLSRIFLTAGTLEESKQALEVCEQHPGLLYTTVGVHPTRANVFESEGNDPKLYLQELLHHARIGAAKGHIVAVGECGLDYGRHSLSPAATINSTMTTSRCCCCCCYCCL